MEISHPRRILILGAARSGAVQVVQDLTGSAPPLNVSGSTAGLTHAWDVATAYYTAKVPIWMDEFDDADAWKREFLKPEAKEVVEAIGAWIYCFSQSQQSGCSEAVRQALAAIQEVSEEHVGYGADAVMLAAAIPQSKGTPSSATDHGEWEDLCLEYGFEYIDYAGKGMNEFREKAGFDRLKEALEANEWTAAGGGGDDDDEEANLSSLDFDHDDDLLGSTRDEAEMTAELFGLKAALARGDLEPDDEHFVAPNVQARQVDDLGRLMDRLLAVKEQSADLPEAQRKRMAAKAVKELMEE